MLRDGSLTVASLVWREGMDTWQPAGELAEVREALAQGQALPEAPGQGQPESQAQAELPRTHLDLQPDRLQPESHAQAEPPGAALVPGPQMPVVPQQNGMALTSLVLGIVSLVLGTLILTAIPGVICGHIARRQIRESPYPQGGDGMAIAGLILGYLCIILTAVMILVFLGFLYFVFESGGF